MVAFFHNWLSSFSSTMCFVDKDLSFGSSVGNWRSCLLTCGCPILRVHWVVSLWMFCLVFAAVHSLHRITDQINIWWTNLDVYRVYRWLSSCYNWQNDGPFSARFDLSGFVVVVAASNEWGISTSLYPFLFLCRVKKTGFQCTISK